MAVRYNKKLNTSINSIVRNFNAKISRLEKVEEELYLPEKVSVNEIKQTVKNRQELNRLLKELQMFSKRGMEKTISYSSGVEMSKYQSEILKKELRIAKAKVTRDITSFKSTPIKVFGIPQSTPHEYDESYLNLKAQRESLEKDISKLSKKEIERLESNIKSVLTKDEMESMYKENWLSMLDSLSYYGNISEEKKNEIKERLKKISASNFTKMYRNEKSIKAIQEQYQVMVRNKGNVDEDTILDIESTINTFFTNIDTILKDYE